MGTNWEHVPGRGTGWAHMMALRPHLGCFGGSAKAGDTCVHLSLPNVRLWQAGASLCPWGSLWASCPLLLGSGGLTSPAIGVSFPSVPTLPPEQGTVPLET